MADERAGDLRRGQDTVLTLAVVAFTVAAGALLARLVVDGSAVPVARTVFTVASGVWLLLVLAFVGAGGARAELDSGDPVRAGAVVVGALAFTAALAIGLVQAVTEADVLATPRVIAGAVVAVCFLVGAARRALR